MKERAGKKVVLVDKIVHDYENRIESGEVDRKVAQKLKDVRADVINKEDQQ